MTDALIIVRIVRWSPRTCFELRAVRSSLGLFEAVGRREKPRERWCEDIDASIDSPDGSFSRLTYRAWDVEHADPNDTVEESTYRALRENLPSSSAEKQALEHARRHANTTHQTYLDPVGRECGSLARGEPGTADRKIEFRLDVDGNQREVIDPRGLVAFRYHRDMRGRPLHDESVDSGPLWALPDARDRTAWSWNARGLEYERGFDLAGRPMFVHVRGGDGATALDHRVVEHLYGESILDRQDAIRRNLLGRTTAIRDSSGESSVGHYDPTGQSLVAHRRILDDDGSREIDWRTPPAFAAGTFTVTRTCDGLGRPVTDTLPDGTRRRFEYQLSGSVARVLVTTPDGTFTDLPVLRHAEVNARGQRTAVRLGNNIDVAFVHDRDTFRLAQHTVRRGARRLRDERYTYDPIGNLVRIDDPSQDGPEAIIANASVGTRRDYTYDAHYRLRTATGRVHQGLLPHDHVPGTPGAFKQSRHLSLNNGAALERYTRTYELDASGNLTSIRHSGASHNWTTNLWVDPTSNRSLPATDHTDASVTDPGSQFDVAGNVRRLDHLRDISWSWQNTLQRAVVIARPNGTDDAERYVYGADRQRVRRISTRVVHGDIETTEKLYLGDQELLRITRNGAPILERWTTHVGDGTQRLALIHRWTRDDLARETDDVTRSRLRYQLEDHQRSATLELDETGQIISYEEHFPYGGTSNGGSSAWIVRVAPGADDADVTVKTAGSSPTDVFTATARSPGEWGNGLRLSIEPVVEGGNVSSGHFSLGVTRYASRTSPTVVATERFAMLDNNNFAASVNDVAQLVRLTSHASTQPAFNGTLGNKKIQTTTGLSGKTFHVNGRPASLELPAGIAAATPLTHVNIRAMVETAIRKAGAASPVEATLVGATVTLVGGRLWIRTDPRTPGYAPDKRIAITTMATDTLDLNAIGMDAAFASVQEYELVGADDGVAADPTAIKGDPSAKTGLWALENADLFNILCLPITTELDEASAKAVMDAALAYCVRRRAMYIVDIAETVTTPTAAQDWRDANANQIRSPNAAMYFPRVLLPDPKDGYRPRPMPNSGTIAGVWARTDTERGVWKAPAGIDAIMRGVVGFEYTMSDGENGVLNPLGIDCLRNFPVYGQIVWGARTLFGADAQASEWKYIPIRRLALMIEESLFRGTKWVVFEPNDEPLWAKIRQNVGAFMTTLFRQGAFQGSTPDKAFFVKCDGETTTAADRNLGVVNIEVGFAPLKPAEFVVLKIQQIPDLI